MTNARSTRAVVVPAVIVVLTSIVAAGASDDPARTFVTVLVGSSLLVGIPAGLVWALRRRTRDRD